MIIEIDDVLLNFEVFGEGDPVLILHGWGGSINSVAPIWQFLKNKYKVFVIDFPGQNNGSSEPKEPWGVYDYAKLVEDFMTSQNIIKPKVIAHSFGGRVAIFLSSRNEDLFDKIVLVDAAGVKPKKSLKTKLKIAMFKCGKQFIKITSKGDNQNKKLNALRKKYSSPDYASLGSDVMRQTFTKVVSLDLTENLKQIKNPTLIIWGENDKDTPLYMGKIMEKKIKDSGLVVLEGAGHFSYIDEARRFNAIVDTFFNS